MEQAISLEAGLAILSDDSSAEARIIDAMSLLSGFYPNAYDQVIPALTDQLMHGKTAEIRSEAALMLFVGVASPGSLAAIDEAIPLLDKETRDEVETLMTGPGSKTILKHARDGKPGGDDDLAWCEARKEKLLTRYSKRAGRMSHGLIRHELDLGELLDEPHPVVDIAHGGIGYRIDIIPKRKSSASLSIWVALKVNRCAIGPRSASLKRVYITGLGRRRSTRQLRSVVRAVRQGRISELISPDGSESLMLVDTGGKVAEAFKSSSTVPDEGDVPDDWVPKSYEPY